MCRKVTIDEFYDVHSVYFGDWLIGLFTHQPVIMATADQKYKKFLFDLLSSDQISEHHYKIYLRKWVEECAQKLEEFNNGK